MTKTRAIPTPGEHWRHCKGTLYVILALAMHTESGQELVIYRKASDPVATGWARPLAMFMDRHSTGTWRFEREIPELAPSDTLEPLLDTLNAIMAEYDAADGSASQAH